MKILQALCMAATLLLTHAVVAQTLDDLIEQDDEAALRKVAAYLDGQHRVRKEIEADKAYRGLDRRTREALFKAQDRLFVLLAGVSSFAELNPSRQVEVRNAQQLVRAALTGARDQREVCWRERRVGTKIVDTFCATQAELDFKREQARGYLTRPRVCAPPCGP